jgi:hypothetical protein
MVVLAWLKPVRSTGFSHAKTTKTIHRGAMCPRRQSVAYSIDAAGGRKVPVPFTDR